MFMKRSFLSLVSSMRNCDFFEESTKEEKVDIPEEPEAATDDDETLVTELVEEEIETEASAEEVIAEENTEYGSCQDQNYGAESDSGISDANHDSYHETTDQEDGENHVRSGEPQNRKTQKNQDAVEVGS